MRQNKREERFQAILDAAESVFGEFGFKRTSLEDVASRAGIGKATLYHYVEGKPELFGEVLQRFFERQTTSRREAVEAEPTAKGRLRKLAETAMSRHGAAVKLLAPRANEEPEHVPLRFKYIRTFREQEKELISAVLEFGIQRGEFRPLDVPLTAALMELAVKGMVMELSTAPHWDLISVYADLFTDVFLKGIQSDRGE